MTHKYDDNCICQSCRDIWNKALVKALDREKKK